MQIPHMKKTLAELTAAQFVDLVCGDTSVLLDKREIPNQLNVAIASRNIVIEYKSIADPGAIQSFLAQTEEGLKINISIVIFTMCKTLISLKAFDKAKEVLDAFGMSVSNMSDKRLKIEINSRLARAKHDLERIESESSEDEEPDADAIRKAFDKQTAAMMAHFKFQIDMSTMQATLYAHLVERFGAEIKAQKNAMRQK